MNIGKAIKILRKERGMSQEALSAASGITQAALSQIERGKRPGPQTVKSLSKVFGLPESLLYAMSIEREEIPQENQELYDQLFPVIQHMILQLSGHRKASE